ncbi:hypothetical protein TAMA11512_15890 [Selenomonas sp. TAMA-11512]|uniref:hypothetical protein n=1 Tax=Selenomonas sp. TAMA-11512 TaxID=3095337 RepID=UPI00308AFD8A|nr:hypothetical protein TAMA11512_15890 [Selenomonas sp. TAMA-11512]
MIHLAKMLSAISPEAYSGAMIARLAWQRDTRGETRGVHILRDTRRVLSLLAAETAEGKQGRLSIDLLRPVGEGYVRAERREKGEAGNRLSSGGHRFTPEEIAVFLEATGDKNPIHRTSCPVVPGLLLLHTFLEMHPAAAALQMKFCAPIYAGELVELQEKENIFLGIVDGQCRYRIEGIV